MRYLLLLAAFALASCSVIKKITGHTIKDQPVCDPGVEWVVPTGRILVTGDGELGNSNWLDTLRSAVVTCPECAVRVDAGDIYPTGVEDRDDYDELMKGEEITPYPDFRTWGNHTAMSDDNQLLVDLSGKCDRFALTDNETFWLYSINTNYLSKSQLEIAERYICDKPGMRLVIGHHPMRSADSKKSRYEQERATKHHLHAMLKRCDAIYITGHAHHSEWSIIDGVPQILEGRLGRSLRDHNEDRPFIWAYSDEYGYAVLNPKDRSLRFYGVKSGLLYETTVP